MKLSIISANFTFLLLIDNTSNVLISKDENIACTQKLTEHDIIYHHIQDLIQNSTIKVLYIESARIAADELIKTLRTVKFREFQDLVSLSKENSDLHSDNNQISSSGSRSVEIRRRPRGFAPKKRGYFQTIFRQKIVLF
jgi:hypothetical protein